MSTNILSATQLAIIAAIVLIVADTIGLFAAITAFNEEQQSKEENNREIETKIKYLQSKLRY